ncbi:hypothetical protein [Dactylosporangium sp. NPDC005555]|uniref:hypothetical protein n=1 Tax=Dactylosporangium sp. NPDC005555 TaxID=3154889 RepID=UPI0033B5153E
MTELRPRRMRFLWVALLVAGVVVFISGGVVLAASADGVGPAAGIFGDAESAAPPATGGPSK